LADREYRHFLVIRQGVGKRAGVAKIDHPTGN
jgi:hypothetical protein